MDPLRPGTDAAHAREEWAGTGAGSGLFGGQELAAFGAVAKAVSSL